jgi:hypothetical protein
VSGGGANSDHRGRVSALASAGAELPRIGPGFRD